MTNKVIKKDIETTKEEIKNIVLRIQKTLKECKEQYYTPMPQKIKKEIFFNLLAIQKNMAICHFIRNIDEECFEEELSKVKSKNLKHYLNNIVNLVKCYYTCEVAESVVNILSDMDISRLSTISNLSESDILILTKKMNISSILCEIELPKEITYVETAIDKIYSSKSSISMYELIGLKNVLVDFEKSISMIKNIEKSNERNAFFDYIDNNVALDFIITKVCS